VKTSTASRGGKKGKKKKPSGTLGGGLREPIKTPKKRSQKSRPRKMKGERFEIDPVGKV